MAECPADDNVPVSPTASPPSPASVALLLSPRDPDLAIAVFGRHNRPSMAAGHTLHALHGNLRGAA